MEIRFWGVRGSIASPGARTAGVGGNTSCVEVRCGDRVIVLDAGTGLRGLGDRLAREGVRSVHLLLSHLHWDHIQGLPFFAPAWMPGTRVDIFGAPSTSTPGLSLEQSIAQQMMPPHFPVRLADMRAEIGFAEIEPGASAVLGDVTLRAARLRHPGGVLGWRIEHGGRSVVYATDTEHDASGPESCPDPHLVALARGADVLIYDAMYTEDEYAGRSGPSKVGWGHSTWEAGVAVADAAGVAQLVLFHHDPMRDDAAVEAIEREADARRPGTIAAREGLELALG
ncbi:MAG: MBL fold metallo-hydrolase, partial [Myxococcota bacterium]|nr:MBL fold metallo-hydrolase [Myxococcota bacterium]